MKIVPKTRAGWIRFAVVLLACVGVASYILLINPLIQYSRYQPEEGDVIFQSLPELSDLVGMIEGVTESPYSHCGVVVKEGGEWYVIESIGRVRKTKLFSFTWRGRRSKFDVYRLKPESRAQIPRFVAELKTFIDQPYDYRFRMDDEALYCSELVYKAWKNATGAEMGVLVKLGDLKWQPYEATIRKYEGGDPPLDIELITPRDLAQADQLDLVHDGGLYAK